MLRMPCFERQRFATCIHVLGEIRVGRGSELTEMTRIAGRRWDFAVIVGVLQLTVTICLFVTRVPLL
jgi:hypothetical protein